jgi:hypothetical protein
MSIANYLVNLTDGLTSQGVLGSSKGGTGLTTVGSSGQAIVSDGTYWVSQTVASGAPKVSQISYVGDNTAANPTGGETVTLTGTGFATGARVLINQTQVSVVTVVSATQITFTTPALATGSYVLYVVNTDGGTAVVVPGIQVSGVPSWTTAAGTLGTVYETAAIATTVAATSDSAVTYSVISGALPSGATLAANGTISGTSPVTASSTTYTFTIRANDAENQETDRTFNLTINPDVVSWSSPANAATLTGAPGVAYSSALSAASAAGQTVSYSANTLPAGLAISGATITGTPTVAGTSSTTLTATSAVTNRTAQVTISWTITVAADAYFPLTTLLLNSETVAAPFTADASTNNFAVTAFGDTKPNSFNPYTPGYYSNYFDGTGDYLTVPSSSNLAFGTSDFCVEMWYYQTASTGIGLFSNSVSSGGGDAQFEISLDPTNLYPRLVGWATVFLTSSVASPLNKWNHLAVCRSGTTVSIFLNGTRTATATVSQNFSSVNSFNIGRSASGGSSLTGYMSNVRAVKGASVYDPTLTTLNVTTTPLTAIANTQLLTCQSNRLLDNSTNAFAVTKNGDTTVSPFVPFQPNTSYSTYGSTYFDGTGDYLSTTGAGLTASGNFTVEAWIYITAGGTAGGFVNTQGASTSGIFLGMSSANILTFKLGSDSGGFTVTDIVALPLNTWIHVAGVRIGNTLTLYKNGVSVGSTGSVTNTAVSTTAVVGRYYSDYNGFYFNGYISDARIVTGTAVYTTTFTPPATPLTAITNTQLLTCQTNQPVNNQTFLDNSTSALPITYVGSATQGSFAPYGANWSNYFDGSGDSLTATGNASLAFGTGDFTVEAWLYQTVANTYPTVLEIGNHLQTDGILFINYGTTIAIYSGGFYGTNTTTLNAWNHVAWVRSSGVLKIYVNGVGGAGVAFTNNLTTNTPYIGLSTNGGAGYTYTGYISNLRIVKGTAVYTSNFTPSTTPLTPITGTSLLTCQSPNLVDNSLNAFTLTKAGDVSVQKFNPFATVTQTPNTYSTYFDGSGDYLSVANNTAFDLPGDFTLEGWINLNSTVNQTLIGKWWTGGQQWVLQFRQAGQDSIANQHWRFYANNGSTAATDFTEASTTSVTTGTWHHIALTRSGSSYKFFRNGTQVGSTYTNAAAITATTDPLTIGQFNNTSADYFTGYISNLRIVKGTALYTTNFTPATTALTAITNTSLLTCQDATLIDNSVNQFALTTFGDTKPRRQNPFGFTTSAAQDYSPAIFGSSVYSDGTGTLYNNTASPISGTTIDWTMEAWCYFNAFTANTWVMGLGNNTGGTTPYLELRIVGSGTGIVLSETSTVTGIWTITGSLTFTPGQWYHLAGTRSGTTVRLFVNGTQVATGTHASAIQAGMKPFSQGLLFAGGTARSDGVNGYVSDARMVAGTALYTANFVPPTAPLTAIKNTSYLINGDKAAIQDKSSKVVLQTVGDAKISTAVKKYGSSSMYFDGTGDYLYSPATTHVANFGTGDFTVEFWIYLNTVPTNTAGILTTYTSGNFYINFRSSGSIALTDVTTEYARTASALTAGSWFHIAVVRNSGSSKIYTNGVGGTAVACATNWNTPSLVYACGDPNGAINGYIDDLRVTKGYARYTTNFTPPSSALLTK